jgi:hypothetical protein
LSEYQIFGMEDYVYTLPAPLFSDCALVRTAGKQAVKLLDGLIFAYAKKELSHQSDILNAFAGVADMMRYDCEAELFYGLVSSALTNSMLWRLSDPPGSRRTGFPSWSWCGWQGGVDGRSVESLSKWTTK